MRIAVFFAASALLAGCGGAHDPVTVLLSIADTECEEALETCGTRQRSQGIVAEAFDPGPDELTEHTGDRLLYVDFPAPDGGLGIIEITQPRSGFAKVRYREVFRGEVSFSGAIVSQDVQLRHGEGDEPLLFGTFEFTAVDAGRETRRRVHSGHVLLTDTSGVLVPSPSPSGPRPFEPEVPSPAEPPPEPSPDPDPRPNPPRGPEVSVVVVETASGCSDPTPESSGCDDSSSSGGGCDAPSSSSGCEADSFDAGGCDSASSSGCEADSFDAGGCDNCSAQGPAPKVRLLHAIFRMLWPMLLVGAVNRRMRHRLELRSRAERSASADL